VRHLAQRIADDLYNLFKRRIRRTATALYQGLRALFGVRGGGVAAPPAPGDPAAPMDTPCAAGMGSHDPAPVAALKDLVIRTPRGIYDRLEPGSVTELTKTYSARFQGPGQEAAQVTIRLANSAAGGTLIQNEVTTLRALQRDARQFAKHLPRVVDQFRTADGKLATVLDHLDGLSLRELRQRFPEGIPHRHATWMLRRCLSVLGYAHSRGVLHGNLTPERILVRAQDHNVWLTDWCYAVTRPDGTGQGFQAVDAVYGAPEAHRQQTPLPGSDLYSLALCVLYALGGNPAARTLPQDTPERLARFIRFLLTDSPLQRPKDAWELYRVLEGIRDEVYGPHRFVEFAVPEPAGQCAEGGQGA